MKVIAAVGSGYLAVLGVFNTREQAYDFFKTSHACQRCDPEVLGYADWCPTKWPDRLLPPGVVLQQFDTETGRRG